MKGRSMKGLAMKGLWLERGKFVYREDLIRPTPATGELLIKTLCAGICGTDLELQRGYYAFTGIAGHEFVGEVVTPGDDFGKRIVAEINIGCGECIYCRAGDENHCPDRKVIGIRQRAGAFAEYLLVPEDNILEVPDSISNQHAVLIEPLAAALEILEQVDISLFDRAFVIGAGRLGILVARVLASAGLAVSILVRNRRRVQHLGEVDIQILESATDHDFRLVVETSGQAGGFATALSSVSARGTIIMKSTYDGQLEFDASKLVVNEVTLVGSRCGPLDQAVKWLLAHPLGHLQFSSHAFEDVDNAIARAGDPAIYKVIFEPESS